MVSPITTTDNKKALLKMMGEEAVADDSKEAPTVTPFNQNTHGPWYDFTFCEWKDNGLGDNYPHYKGYDAEARAKIFEAYQHLDVFEREEDPVWTFNQPDRKTFEAKLRNTYNCRMGAEDKAENERYCKAVSMGIKRFEKALSRGCHKYVEHIKRMNDKAIVRNNPYHAGTPLQLFRYERDWNDNTLFGDMKTQRIYNKTARFKNLNLGIEKHCNRINHVSNRKIIMRVDGP